MITLIILFIFLLCTINNERKDWNAIANSPHCNRIKNFCSEFGKKNNIKYVIKEPIQKETIDSLLSVMTENTRKLKSLVYWRISFIISTLICILLWFYNDLNESHPNKSFYFVLLLIGFIVNYYGRNFLDFHYYDRFIINMEHAAQRIREKMDL